MDTSPNFRTIATAIASCKNQAVQVAVVKLNHRGCASGGFAPGPCADITTLLWLDAMTIESCLADRALRLWKTEGDVRRTDARVP